MKMKKFNRGDSWFDHPAQAGWSVHPSPLELERVTTSLGSLGYDTAEIDAVLPIYAAASREVSVEREKAHSDMLQMLQLPANAFDQFAGRADRLHQAIHWFHEASKALPEGKVALELGGVRQSGDWDGTFVVDGAVDRALAALKYVHQAKHAIVRSPVSTSISYRLGKIDVATDRGVQSHVLLVRRRPEADVVIEENNRLHVFKQSVTYPNPRRLSPAILSAVESADIEGAESAVLPMHLPEADIVGRALHHAALGPRSQRAAFVPIATNWLLIARKANIRTS